MITWKALRYGWREFRHPPRFSDLTLRERLGLLWCYLRNCSRRNRDMKPDAPARGTQRCPRRDGTPFYCQEGLQDGWERDQIGGPRRCSFCGYLHPEDALEAVARSETKIDPSTKKYKVYLHGPLERQIRGAAKVGFYHFNQDQLDRWNEIVKKRGPEDYLPEPLLEFWLRDRDKRA